MKARFAPAIAALLMAASAFAAEKYVSTEFGFAASYPAEVVRTQPKPEVSLFAASAPGGAWTAQVRVSSNVAFPKEIGREFMAGKLAEVLKDGGMTQTGTSTYSRFEGHPALTATGTFVINNENTNFVSYLVVVDMKVIFVKGDNRMYVVNGLAVQGNDRSHIQPFIDSFELR